jgi:hypothetical protein
MSLDAEHVKVHTAPDIQPSHHTSYNNSIIIKFNRIPKTRLQQKFNYINQLMLYKQP